MNRELLQQVLDVMYDMTFGNKELSIRCNNLAHRLRQELSKPEPRNSAAWHWHDLYKAKCQEFHDKQAMLGTEIVALEKELAELKEEQLDKPEQEPVAIMSKNKASIIGINVHSSNIGRSDWIKLYTSSPRKEWQGLTSDEVAQLTIDNLGYPTRLTAAIEVKLKEKNT